MKTGRGSGRGIRKIPSRWRTSTALFRGSDLPQYLLCGIGPGRILCRIAAIKWNRWVDHPRWLAALTLVFALVPAWLAVVTWRDARAKDERLFQTSAQVLTEQLQRKFDEHLYFPGLIRNQAGRLDAAALAAGQMVPAFEWKEKLPHLIAFGYAELDGNGVIMRWKSEERAPVSGMGADLAADPAVADKLARRDVRDSFATCGVGQKNSRLLVLMAVRPLPVPRGYVVAWLDLDSFCRHSPLTLLKDEVLSAASVEDDAPPPADTVRAKIHSSSAKWMVNISRGHGTTATVTVPLP